jgi:hypothetical protein
LGHSIMRLCDFGDYPEASCDCGPPVIFWHASWERTAFGTEKALYRPRLPSFHYCASPRPPLPSAMSSVHTLSFLSETLHAGPQQAQPRLHLLPVTSDHSISTFKDVQSGPNRTIIPTFSTPIEERQYRKEHLVLVFRALHRHGLAEGIAGELEGLRLPIWTNDMVHRGVFSALGMYSRVHVALMGFPDECMLRPSPRTLLDARPRRAQHVLGEPARPVIRPYARLRSYPR